MLARSGRRVLPRWRRCGGSTVRFQNAHQAAVIAKSSKTSRGGQLEFAADPRQVAGMKILTDDPDWGHDVYQARALAMTFVEKHGRAVPGCACRLASGNGLTITHHPNRSPVLLTIDAPGVRVFSVEWHDRDAWRMTIETFQRGRWESRLQALVHPRPWLQRWRAAVSFTGSLPPGRTT
jgi:hypothetical protein